MLPASIVAAMHHHARVRPAAPAILYDKQTITYADLACTASEVACALVAAGVGHGDRVAIFLENCPEFVATYLGTQLAGGIVVLINTQYRQAELAHIIADAGVKLVITNSAGAAELVHPAVTTRQAMPEEQAVPPLLVVIDGVPTEPETRVSLIGWEAFLAAGRRVDSAVLRMPAGDDPAVIAYTSGTTGRAKGALLLHRNQIANIAAVSAAWDWSASDRLYLALPLFHTHGLMVGLHGTLYTGASAILRPRFDAAEFLATLMDDPAVSLFFGVPTLYTRLLTAIAASGQPPRPLRLYVSGSAPLSPQTFAAFQRLTGAAILERYGMTETIMNLTNPYAGERRSGTVGMPFPGQAARIVDLQTCMPLPSGEIGEIEVRGPQVFVGYWQRPAETDAAFSADGWFRTGDLGMCSADGYYTITGRARELIISGGYNISPREVEEVLANHPAVAEVAVFGLPDPDFGEQVVAAVVLQPARLVTAESLIAWCRSRLASFKKPRHIIFLEALPRNALGKVQKHVLRERVNVPR